MKIFLKFTTRIIYLIIGIILFMYFYYSGDDWRTASRQSSGIAPNALLTNEAVVQVYGADAWSKPQYEHIY